MHSGAHYVRLRSICFKPLLSQIRRNNLTRISSEQRSSFNLVLVQHMETYLCLKVLLNLFSDENAWTARRNLRSDPPHLA